MKTGLVILLVVAAFVGFARGADQPSKDPYETVKTAEHFALGRVGFAGIISAQESAFRQLLTQPHALDRCQSLTTQATPAGQLYGLLGLHLLDQKAFEAALPRYKNSKAEVPTMNGCMISRRPTSTVAAQIEKGDLK